ncbi:unnamed protein product [Urochloa decumbens]|uniref:Uncharacterized protein n=1 Tax=Urochloa decumbens TaxID=240449 RepID=A0ABC9BBS7_9POAL
MTSLRFASPRLAVSGYYYHSSTSHRPGTQRAVPRPRRLPFFSFHKSQQLYAVQSRARHPVHAVSGSSIVEVRDLEGRIREQLTNSAAESLPPSAYDTAWVAMVPATVAVVVPVPAPRFPGCVRWILHNQHADGSWGVDNHDPSLRKDALLSTLACVLALTTWGAGDDHVTKGLRFIARNSSAVTDDTCDTPQGFNVIFPGMLARGLDMGLEIPLTPEDVDAIFRLRDMELKSMDDSGSKAFMAYVAEGLGDLVDWDQATMYQRKNGSFFDSPATTAATVIHNNNGRALDYLNLLVSKFGSPVPTMYPRYMYSCLRMVDTLEKMGISLSFSSEINSILDMIYSSWLANDEEIMLDMTTCAMAFRLLRMHGYEISSGGLARFSEESSFYESVAGHLNDTEALLELYKASQILILEDELILEKIGSWSAQLLKQQLCANKISISADPAEVERVLKYPFHTTLERLEHRWNIEHFKTGRFQMLKSAYRTCQADEEIIALATDGFHSSQAVYQQDLEHLNRWVKEARLDELEFVRMMPLHVLFSAASTMFPSALSEARIAWTKMSVVTTALDDLFDTVGTREELNNLVKLIDMWDEHEQVGFCSERAEIVFRSIYDACHQIGAKAAAVQNRSVVHHLAELWAEVSTAMLAEAEWKMSGHIPSIEEYMKVGISSYSLATVITASAYVMVPELTEDVVRSVDYGELVRHMSICGRLTSDLQQYEREKEEQGKHNSVLVLADRHGGDIEAAKREVKGIYEASRRELLRLVLRDGGAVPRPCRMLFWYMCKATNFFYLDADTYVTPKEMMQTARSVVLDPLRLPPGTMIGSPGCTRPVNSGMHA